MNRLSLTSWMRHMFGLRRSAMFASQARITGLVITARLCPHATVNRRTHAVNVPTVLGDLRWPRRSADQSSSSLVISPDPADRAGDTVLPTFASFAMLPPSRLSYPDSRGDSSSSSGVCAGRKHTRVLRTDEVTGIHQSAINLPVRSGPAWLTVRW